MNEISPETQNDRRGVHRAATWMRAHRGVQETLWTLATAILSIGAGAWVLKLWRGDLRIPLAPGGDTYLGLTAIKSMVENGWYLSTPALGAPHAQNVSDFGGFNGDSISWLILKFMSLFTGDPALLLNLFYLLGFGLAGAVAYLVMRNLGVSRLTGLALSVFYANLSFHFTHGEGHLMLSAYFAVPAGMWLVLRVLAGRPLFRRSTAEGWRSWVTPLNAGTLGAIILAGGCTLYFAVFTLLLLLFATPIRAIASRSWRALLTGAGAFVAVAVVLLLNLSPGIAYRLANGPNLAVAARSAYESELYSFSLTRLVALVSGHRWTYLSDLGNRIAGSSLTTGEGETLGVILGLTFLTMIGMLLVWAIRSTGARGPRGAVINAAVVTAMVAFLLGTTGGVGALIANVISPQIRAWGRITPFLALACLIVLAFAVDWGRRRLARIDRRRVLSTALPLLVAGVAIIDQTSPSNIPDYVGGAARWNTEAAFVQSIETALPSGSTVLQLPFHDFPEAGGVNGMGDYDHIVGYVHSNTLRWSYGAAKGRRDNWTQAAKGVPLREVLTAAAAAGFGGVWVDNAAYKDKGRVMDARVQAIVGSGTPAIHQADGRRVFWPLAPLHRRIAAVTSPAQRATMAAALVDPTTIEVGTGFYQLETDGERIWHWATNDATMTIVNEAPGAQRVRWTAMLTGADDASTTVYAGSKKVAYVRVNTRGVHVNLLLVVPPGGLPLRFVTTGTDLGPQNNDARSLYLQVSDPAVHNLAYPLVVSPAATRADVP